MAITFVVISCATSDNEEVQNVDLVLEENRIDSVRENLRSAALSWQKENPNRINYIDEKGLKQGKWEELAWKNKIAGFVHYVNDTLNGRWVSHHGISVSGFYEKGKKEGYERHFYHTDVDSNTLALGYYENDTVLWFAHPNSDHGLILLAKGMQVHVDSVYIKVPFKSGTFWYEGLYILKEPVGEHKFYYPNGQLQGVVDHANETFIEYDSKGNLLRKGGLADLTFIKRFGIGAN